MYRVADAKLTICAHVPFRGNETFKGVWIMTAQDVRLTEVAPEALFGDLKHNWGWLLFLGILFVVLGIVGLGSLFVLTLAGALLFGVLIVVGGVAQFIEAFKCRGWKSMILHVVIAILYVVAGVFVLFDPLLASVLLTWVLGIVLIVVGVLRIIMAVQMRSAGGWFIPLLGGLFSIILGVLILAQWPASGLFIIGLFIAIELIINGWTYIFVALAARSAKTRGTAEATP
jgi:uncharacterized membrane protein HdeD (DUF308 family)